MFCCPNPNLITSGSVIAIGIVKFASITNYHSKTKCILWPDSQKRFLEKTANNR